MAFVGIVLFSHKTFAVSDVLKCLAGEPTETNKVVALNTSILSITYNVLPHVIAVTIKTYNNKFMLLTPSIHDC